MIVKQAISFKLVFYEEQRKYNGIAACLPLYWFAYFLLGGVVISLDKLSN